MTRRLQVLRHRSQEVPISAFRQATMHALASDPAEIQAAFRMAHERMVGNPPWLYVVHDLNPQVMSKRVQGFTPVKSWFLDLTAISLRP